MQENGRGLERATLKDIAKEVNVSVAAVSKALNGKGSVSKETQRRIEDVASRLNYIPNNIARSLRVAETKTLGVVVSDGSQAFFAKVIRGIQDTAYENGYSIILCNTDQDYEKEKQAIELLAKMRVDGIMIAATTLLKESDVAFLKKFDIPFVFLIRQFELADVDFVINDDVLGSYMLTKYLIKVGGAAPIHFFDMPQFMPSSRTRLSGYQQALAEEKIQFDRSLVHNVKMSVDAGYIAIRQLFEKKEAVSTVYCGCDTIAIGVMEFLVERGIKIPQAVRVAGYDDIDYAEYLRVPLTTVRQPKEQIGRWGTEIIIKRLKNPALEPQHIILKPELVIRDST